MKLHNRSAKVFVPDGKPLSAVLKRITHLGIGAHQDDLEFMAFHGILQCFASPAKWFGGVTCTNGAGSSRSGAYAGVSDRELMPPPSVSTGLWCSLITPAAWLKVRPLPA